MAVTILQSPSRICFAGNPMMIKTYTDLSDKTFLKICVEVDANLYQKGDFLRQSVFNFSIPTEGGTKATWFDISSCIRSMFSQVKKQNLNEIEHDNIFAFGCVIYSFKVWDEYLDDQNEIVSSKRQAATNGNVLYSIPGELNDMQRMESGEDIAALLGIFKVMSNKPDGEIIPLHGILTYSIFSIETRLSKILVNGSWNNCNVSLIALEVVPSFVRFLSIGVNRIDHDTINPEINNSTITVTVIDNPLANPIYFEFYNRLGALESIYCYGLRKETINIESENNNLHQGLQYMPSAKQKKRVKQAYRTISTSTGPLNREWAQWFVEEFFQSEYVWMRDDKTGSMVPVIIKPDENLSVMDDNEAQVIDIQFEIIRGYDGYTVGHFV